METSDKQFDAVRMMRSLRDALGEQLRGLTFEEQREYLRNRLRSPTARSLFRDASDNPRAPSDDDRQSS